MHRDLKFAGECTQKHTHTHTHSQSLPYLPSHVFSPGLLNPLDCPHHMRADDVCLYREGVVSEPTVIDGSKKRQRGPLVDCGMRQVT